MQGTEADAERRFRFLSRNETKVVYMETDMEQVSMMLRILVEAEDKDRDELDRLQELVDDGQLDESRLVIDSAYEKALQHFRKKAQSSEGSRRTAVVNVPWLLNMMKQLFRLGPHFNHHPFLRPTPLYGKIMKTGGGVSHLRS